MSIEEWRPVVGYEGLYEVSSIGRIKRIQIYGRPIQRFLSSNKGKRGYIPINLCKNGKSKKELIHRIVLTAFRGPPLPTHESCHSNGIASDNRIENLRWDTHVSNCADRKTHGTHAGGCHMALAGEAHHQSKLTMKDVHRIREASLFGADLYDLASIYDVSYNAIWSVTTRKSWTHI